MKNVLLLTLIIISTSFKPLQNFEIKIEDFEKMAFLNANDFESYILSKGFKYYETKEYKKFDVLYYKNNNTTISKAVPTDLAEINAIFYQTLSSDHYLNLKKQAELLGYKYIGSVRDSDNPKNSQSHNYNKGSNNLNFSTSKDGYLVGMNIKIK